MAGQYRRGMGRVVDDTHPANVGHCDECDKRIHTSKSRARVAVRTVGNRVRVYRCPAGSGWHITSKAEL